MVGGKCKCNQRTVIKPGVCGAIWLLCVATDRMCTIIDLLVHSRPLVLFEVMLSVPVIAVVTMVTCSELSNVPGGAAWLVKTTQNYESEKCARIN